MTLTPKIRQQIAKRSGDCCEVCGDRATEIHHRLPRSRGGHILDQAGELWHLAHLCLRCHRDADRHGYLRGLLIQGYVTTNKLTGRPCYTGDDGYLQARYGGSNEQ